MNEIERQLSNGLRAVVVELQRLAELLDSEPVKYSVPPEIAAMVQEKREKGICLQAKDGHPVGKNGTRGVCRKDFNATQHRKKKGLVTERQLIEAGLLTEEIQPPGRKKASASLLDDLIDEMSNRTVADIQAMESKARSELKKKKDAK